MKKQSFYLFSLGVFSYLLTVESQFSPKCLATILLAMPILGQQGYYGPSSYDQPFYDNNYRYQQFQPYNQAARLGSNIQSNPEQRNILQSNRNTDFLNAVTPETFDETDKNRNGQTVQKSGIVVPLVSRSQVPQDSRNSVDDRVVFDEKQNTELIWRKFNVTKPPVTQKRVQAVFEESVKVLTEKTVSAAKIAADITNFGLQLIRNVDKVGNIVVSPGSVAATLALLQQGARGITQYQISTALDMSAAESSAAYKQITVVLLARKSKNDLKITNGIFTSTSFNLNKLFRKLATENFKAEVKNVDFNRPELAVQQINQWVEANTGRHIKELVTPESVTYHSQMVLANAVYFKGVWQTMFNPQATIPMDFHLSNGEVKRTPFMRLITYFKAGLDEEIGSQYIVIPFDAEKYSFVVLLPTPETDLNTVISRLDANRLTEYHKTAPKEVKLSIPKFNLRGDTNLRPVLSKMGITNIFDHQSDLSAITAQGMISPQVSSAMHAAVLSIDEEGSTAAAATAFAAVALASGDDSEYFRADRPFLGMIWDNEIHIPYYMTRIEDPTSMT